MLKDLECLKNQYALVVGDMMIDKYIIGSVDRISPEAPVPVLRQCRVERKLGGAGNVIVNIVSLGAGVRVLGQVGNDFEGHFFRKTLRERGVDDRFIFSAGDTIVKTRVAASNQQFIRVDEEEILPPTDTMLQTLEQNADELFSGITVVIISDYAKGFISDEMARFVIRSARERSIPVLVDPKGKSAEKYRGATAITPNNKEFLDMTGLTAVPDEEEIRVQAWKLCQEHDLERIIFTRSEKGISVIEGSTGLKRDFPAEKKEVIDVTGAGDTVVSVLALTMSAGFPVGQCVKIANVAASIVISRFGAAQTTIEELSGPLFAASRQHDSREAALERIHELKAQGKRIVFTNGCFDLVHAGHISSFRQARAFGDVLVVGLNSDESIARIKGPTRPIVTLKYRLALLTAIKYVDFVIPFGENTPQRLIEEVMPDVLVKGKDWAGTEVAGGAFVRAHGGSVEFIDLEQGLSTTTIIDRIRETLK